MGGHGSQTQERAPTSGQGQVVEVDMADLSAGVVNSRGAQKFGPEK
jgi:hypothetical protein